MNITLRQNIEKQIVQAAVEDLIAAGYRVAVFDGEEIAQEATTEVMAIMRPLFACVENWLYVYASSDKRIGTVVLVYGTGGWDVIQDYTVNLDSSLEKAATLADQLALQYA